MLVFYHVPDHLVDYHLSTIIIKLVLLFTRLKALGKQDQEWSRRWCLARPGVLGIGMGFRNGMFGFGLEGILRRGLVIRFFDVDKMLYSRIFPLFIDLFMHISIPSKKYHIPKIIP